MLRLKARRLEAVCGFCIMQVKADSGDDRKRGDYMGDFSFCESYKKYFDIGAAVNPWSIKKYGDLLKKHFNSVTCENEMKYIITHPEEDKYDFSKADEIVSFAKANGMKVRGHAPVWHSQTPNWIFKDGDHLASRELVYERLEQHIKAMAEHFGDDVYCWDAVNEACIDTLPEFQIKFMGNETYRTSRYLTACGFEYVAKAYELWGKYAPNAKLFFNDYNECDPLKRERIVNLIKDVQRAGAPIYGMGMQSHYSIHFPEMDEVKRSIETYAGLGLHLHITEMDISFYMDPFRDPEIVPTEEQIEKQASIYEKLFEMYRSYSDVIDSVTLWGVTDATSWISRPDRKNWPLPFDVDGNPKPFIEKICKAAE